MDVLCTNGGSMYQVNH